MWGEQWVCDCTWSNMFVRAKCRNCGAARRDDHRMEGVGKIIENVVKGNGNNAVRARFGDLEQRIAQKSREIEATGACQWGYRTLAEIEAMPDHEASGTEKG